jgi:lysyl-tRNA synthetase class 2
VRRRGWEIRVLEGRELDDALEAEIDAVESVWRARRRRVLGFAMGMGTFKPILRPDDLYAVARAPEGELRAVMRFAAHREKLSLEAMRRIGETPNGLNEALVVRALEAAAERRVAEVSLNYAGLGHVVHASREGGGVGGAMSRGCLGLLGRRFQLERLVRFNDKFFPEWRPRFLVYESPDTLPRAVVRILQAEGYLREPRQLPALAGRLGVPRRRPGSVSANVAG